MFKKSSEPRSRHQKVEIGSRTDLPGHVGGNQEGAHRHEVYLSTGRREGTAAGQAGDDGARTVRRALQPSGSHPVLLDGEVSAIGEQSVLVPGRTPLPGRPLDGGAVAREVDGI